MAPTTISARSGTIKPTERPVEYFFVYLAKPAHPSGIPLKIVAYRDYKTLGFAALAGFISVLL
jgi:hypothetical protein